MLTTATFNTIIVILLATAVSCLLIEECPHRDVADIRRTAQSWELGLVFYHTAWSSDSRLARASFEALASNYDGLAYFATVDCWHLRCNCSRTLQTPAAATGSGSHGTPDSWPTMIAYYGQGTLSLQYHGEWQLNALAYFMDSLLMPIERLHNRSELRQLAAKCESVVLGLFPDLSQRYQRQQYRRYLLAAVGWLGTDPERNFRFAAAYGSNAWAFLKNNSKTSGTDGSALMPRILMISRTQLTVFSANATAAGGGRLITSAKWSPRQIMQWVEIELRRQISQASNSGYTPTSLAIRMRSHSPVLVIAANDGQLLQLMAQADNEKVTRRRCQSFWRFVQQREAFAVERMPQFASQHRSQKSTCNAPQYLRTAGDWANYHHLLCVQEIFFDHLRNGLNDDNDDDAGNLLDETGIEMGSQNLLEWHRHQACLKQPHHNPAELRIAASKQLQRAIIDRVWTEALHNGPSHSNRSMSLVILDSSKYRDFLHADTQAHLRCRNHSTSQGLASCGLAFIIDTQREHVYQLSPADLPLTPLNLLQFVRQYYKGHPQEEVRGGSSRRRLGDEQIKRSIRLLEYNRDMFMHLIGRHHSTNTRHMDHAAGGSANRLSALPNATTIVLLLYSSECAFSGLYTQTLLQLSALLNTPSIMFIRFNTQQNDLPWEFDMAETPSLLVFPHGQIAESRVFPREFQVNVRNILAFILARLEPTAQVSLVLDGCRQQLAMTLHQRQCLQFAKDLVMQHIATNLKYWQIFANERLFIVDRLKMFKDLSLSIQSSFRL